MGFSCLLRSNILIHFYLLRVNPGYTINYFVGYNITSYLQCIIKCFIVTFYQTKIFSNITEINVNTPYAVCMTGCWGGMGWLTSLVEVWVCPVGANHHVVPSKMSGYLFPASPAWSDQAIIALHKQWDTYKKWWNIFSSFSSYCST